MVQNVSNSQFGAIFQSSDRQHIHSTEADHFQFASARVNLAGAAAPSAGFWDFGVSTGGRRRRPPGRIIQLLVGRW
jgi:hypothetical protein